MFDKIDYKTIRLFGREVRLSINHRERSISARANDGYPTELRVTGYLARCLALGASVRVEYGGDEDVLAGLYLGPLRLYLAGSHRALGNILAACKTGRRVTSIEAELGDRFGDATEGPEIRVRGNLWNDDHHGDAKSRAFSVDLLDHILGKPVTSEKHTIEERMVVVPLPEGSFTTKARLVERFVSRPGWPFKSFARWVEFRETPAVVPRRKSNGVSFYNLGGPWSCVTGSTIEDGVAELVRRVLEDRGRYGGKRWAAGIPAIEEDRDSHEVSVWQIVDGKEIEHWRGVVRHGANQEVPTGSGSRATGMVAGKISAPLRSGGLYLTRDPMYGGIVVRTSLGRVLNIVRGGETIRPFLEDHEECAAVFQGDEIRTEDGCWKIYGSPIGPIGVPRREDPRPLEPEAAPARLPSGPADVRAATILARGEAAGVHVNAGPAIGKTGRIPLRGMTGLAIAMAQEVDPEWVAANPEIAAGARPGRLYDGARWVEVIPEGVRLAIDNPDRQGWASFNYLSKLEWYEARQRAEQDAAARAELDATSAMVADVEQTLAQLDTTPPGPTEEAEGVVAREAMAWLKTVGEAEQASIAISTDFDRERRREIAFAMRHAGIDLATAMGLSPSELSSITHAAREAGGVDLSAGKGDQTVAQDYEVRDGVLHRIGEPRVLDAYRGETSQRYTVALGEHEVTYTAVSAMSAVLGDGAPDLALAPDPDDLPPAPVDTRPWMPTGDLVVVVARGELRQTIRLDCAPTYRIGAHKDAEIRLLGAHTIAATLLQQDGAVWVCRGADNVAVDLLGLNIRETVRLRERAEVQIGSMYTLTITSAAELSRST